MTETMKMNRKHDYRHTLAYGIATLSKAITEKYGLEKNVLYRYLMTGEEKGDDCAERIERWCNSRWDNETVLESRPMKGMPPGQCYDVCKAVWQMTGDRPVIVYELLIYGNVFSFALHGANMDKHGKVYDAIDWAEGSIRRRDRLCWVMLNPAQSAKWLLREMDDPEKHRLTDETYPHQYAVIAPDEKTIYGVKHYQTHIMTKDYKSLRYDIELIP